MYKVWEEYESGLSIECHLLGEYKTAKEAYIFACTKDEIDKSDFNNRVAITEPGRDEYSTSVNSFRRKYDFETLYSENKKLFRMTENGLEEVEFDTTKKGK